MSKESPHRHNTSQSTANKLVKCIMDKSATTVLRVINPILKDRNGDLGKRWYIDMYLETNDGTRKRKPLYISSKKYPTAQERIEHGKRLIKILEKWKPSDGGFKVFHTPGLIDQLELITQHKINETTKKRSQSTYRSDLNIIKEFLTLKRYQKMKVSDFSSSHAYQFSDYLIMHRKVANMTRNNLIIRVSALFNLIIARTGLIDKNPFVNIKQLKVATSFQHVAFKERDQVLLESYLKKNSPQLYFFTRFMYYCFTRVDETLNLKVSDIDQGKRILTIESIIAKTNIRLNKVIPASLWNMILESGVLDLPQDYYLFGKQLDPGRLRSGTNYPANKCRAILKKLELYEKGYYTLYSFRHTGIDRMIENNPDVDIVDLQNHIGHRKIETTMNYTKARKLRINRKLEDRDW